jgi:hypothetical protein
VVTKRFAGLPLFHWLLRAAAFGCLQLISACSNDDALTPMSDAPFVFVVLTSSQAAIGAAPQPDSSIIGLLLTVGSPISSPFLRADSFEMHRTSDGAVFAWTERTPSSGVPGADFRGIVASDGNYQLTHATTIGALGSDSIKPLESYALTIRIRGSQITGVTTVPAVPQPRIVVAGTRRFIVFGPVTGAAGYILSVGLGEFSSGFLTPDTLSELLSSSLNQPPPNSEFQVIALDTNAFRYLSDTSRTSAGLIGALGLFGAASKSPPLPLPSQ